MASGCCCSAPACTRWQENNSDDNSNTKRPCTYSMCVLQVSLAIARNYLASTANGASCFSSTLTPSMGFLQDMRERTSTLQFAVGRGSLPWGPMMGRDMTSPGASPAGDRKMTRSGASSCRDAPLKRHRANCASSRRAEGPISGGSTWGVGRGRLRWGHVEEAGAPAAEGEEAGAGIPKRQVHAAPQAW